MRRKRLWIIVGLALIAMLCPTTGSAQIECATFPYDAPLHLPPEARIDVQHATIEAEPDTLSHVVTGRITMDFQLDGPADSLILATPLVTIDSIFAGATGRPAQPVAFRSTGTDTVIVHLASLANAGIVVDSLLKLAVDFESRGVHFSDSLARAPDGLEPWFPWTGRRGDRFTSELLLTVPEEWSVAAQGMVTAERTTDDGRRTFLFSSPHELPPQRLYFVAGRLEPAVDFAEVGAARRIAVAAETNQAAAEAADLIAEFSRWTRFGYPFERYYQLGRIGSKEPAIAAVQPWVGAVVSAVEWQDVWWEEAFSVYLPPLVHLGDLGAVLSKSRERYFEEASTYVRPLVWQRWHHPSDLHDEHARSKGLWVMHMLRRHIGEEVFQNAVEHFLHQNAFRSVNTDVLLQSFEDMSGQNLASFADEWIFAAGHPVLSVSYEPVSDGVRVSVEQLQSGDFVPAAFSLDLALEIGGLDASERYSVMLEERTQTFTLPFQGRPRYVAVDPDDEWLLETVVEQPTSAWIAQLRSASTTDARLSAARELARIDADPALLLGLRSAFESEPDEVVRAAIISAIGNLDSEAASRALFAAFEDPSATVRAAILAELHDRQNVGQSVDLATRAAQSDPSSSVQAAAVRVLALLEADNAVGIARSALITPSQDDVIRAAGLVAFRHLHHRSPGDAFTAATTYSGTGYSRPTRTAAVRLLGTLAAVNRQAAARLEGLLSDADFEVQEVAARELARIGGFDILRDHMVNSRGRIRSLLASLVRCE